MPAQEQTITMFNGEVIIFKRKESIKGIWSVRCKDKDGSYIIKSTKTADLDIAREFAIRFYYETRALISKNINVKSPTVLKAYQIWLDEYWNTEFKQTLVNNVKPRKKKRRIDLISFQFRKYIIPYFGRSNVSSVDTRSIIDYCVWRSQYYKRDENKSEITSLTKISPSIVSVKMEIGALRTLLKFCVLKGWINSIPIVDIPKNGLNFTDERTRDGVSSNEADMLSEYKDQRYKNEKENRFLTKKHQQQRDLIVLMCEFVRYSALRSGEAYDLRWKDIKVSKDESGSKFIQIRVIDGKTGDRTVVPASQIAFTISEIYKITGKFNDLVFCDPNIGKRFTDPNKTIRTIFKEIGIERKIVLYDFRHLGITEMLLKNVDPYTVSLNAGTSIGHIENTYSKVMATQKADILAKSKIFGKTVSIEKGSRVVDILDDLETIEKDY